MAIREYFTHIDTPSLLVKGYKLYSYAWHSWPMSSEGTWHHVLFSSNRPSCNFKKFTMNLSLQLGSTSRRVILKFLRFSNAHLQLVDKVLFKQDIHRVFFFEYSIIKYAMELKLYLYILIRTAYILLITNSIDNFYSNYAFLYIIY